MIPFGQDINVKIDVAHSEFIKGLVKAHKPRTVLEIGIGGGQSTDAILEGLEFNQQGYHYTVVDNWQDWQGTIPAGVIEKYQNKLEIVTSGEREFVFSCQNSYDLIMSDGDHMRADQWFEYVFANLVSPGGVLIYHDINLVDANAFHNLTKIYERVKLLGLSHYLFNKNSRADERCQRGLLVIYKDV